MVYFLNILIEKRTKIHFDIPLFLYISVLLITKCFRILNRLLEHQITLEDIFNLEIRP